MLQRLVVSRFYVDVLNKVLNLNQVRLDLLEVLTCQCHTYLIELTGCVFPYL